MLHQIFRTLLQPSVTRVSYCGGYELRPITTCLVRYRKNPWSRISPTKLFVVREQPKNDPKEIAELAVLDAHYRTTMKALRYHISGKTTDGVRNFHFLGNSGL